MGKAGDWLGIGTGTCKRRRDCAEWHEVWAAQTYSSVPVEQLRFVPLDGSKFATIPEKDL